MKRFSILIMAALLLAPVSVGAAPEAGAPGATPDAAAAPPPASPAVEGVKVTFQTNDSMVKGKAVAGVRIGVKGKGATDYLATGVTGEDGKVDLSVPPGEVLVSYLKDGYVPVRDSLTTVKSDGQLITSTLSMMLEAAGQGGQRRVQIVLNWGNQEEQARDCDSHLMRLDVKPRLHVFWKYKNHPSSELTAMLDVDDTDGGGPETVTLLDPPAGKYTYWVHNFTGGSTTLDTSEVKVRILFGDEVAAEFVIPDGVNKRFWRPFAALEVDAMLEPKLIPWTEQELTTGDDRAEVVEPGELVEDRAVQEELAGGGNDIQRIFEYIIAGVIILVFVVIWVVKRRG